MVSARRRPNVVLVLTDDQGYGDLGCTGNPWIRTPNLDGFHGQAVRFTDFHVSPLCTPTRGALMTGRRPLRNGAWATCWGRSILRKTEVTMADVFRAGGYRTGLFGKWHLGDNYPYRPQDRGFERVVAHKGGGVGQTPDFWGNNYFDDTYFHNGRPVEHSGYCTDIWFAEAMKFIRECRDEPFFCCLSTNAPHSPYLVADRYRQPYEGVPDIPHPPFYGMITNIDENFGRLRRFLAQRGLEDDTILIFMTDNGSSGGCENDRNGLLTRGYNAGMRGKKGSYYDGGHRVPFFIRWPAGGVKGPRDVEPLALHLDLLPSFIDLCGLKRPDGVDFDGVSLAGLLGGSVQALPDRKEFVQYRQYTNPPEKWTNAVMTARWRLIGGKELYDIQADPGQRRDVAEEFPAVAAELRAAHEQWWEEVSPRLSEYCPISLGNDAENPVCLCAMDVLGDVAWHQSHIIQAQKSTGRWSVDVERPGRYRFRLRRWPDELALPLDAGLSPEQVAQHLTHEPQRPCRTIQPVAARLEVFGRAQVLRLVPGASEAVFELDLDRAGVTTLEAWFSDQAGDERGAYYVYAERVNGGGGRTEAVG
jgi:arylsulfatase A-like enzyme